MTYQTLFAPFVQFSLKLKEVCKIGDKNSGRLKREVIERLPFVFDSFFIKNDLRGIDHFFSRHEEKHSAYLTDQPPATPLLHEEQKTYEYLINYCKAYILQIYVQMELGREELNKPLILQCLFKASLCVMDAYKMYDLMSKQVLVEWGCITYSDKSFITNLFQWVLTELVKQVEVNIKTDALSSDDQLNWVLLAEKIISHQHEQMAIIEGEPIIPESFYLNDFLFLTQSIKNIAMLFYERDASIAKKHLEQVGMIYEKLLKYHLPYKIYKEVISAKQECLALLESLAPPKQRVTGIRNREKESKEDQPALKRPRIPPSAPSSSAASSSNGATFFVREPIDTPQTKADSLYQQANTSKTLEDWIEAAMAYEELNAHDQSLTCFRRTAACYTEAVKVSSPWYEIEGVFDKTWQQMAEAYKKLLCVSLEKEDIDAFYSVIQVAKTKEKLSANYWINIGDFFNERYEAAHDARYLILMGRCYREAAKKEPTTLRCERLWKISFDIFNQLVEGDQNKELVAFRADCLYNYAKSKVDQKSAAAVWLSAAKAYETLFKEDEGRNDAYLQRVAICYQKAARNHFIDCPSQLLWKKAADAYQELVTRGVEGRDKHQSGADFCYAQCQISSTQHVSMSRKS